MITTATKLYLGAAVAALGAAAAYGWGTGGGLSGVLTAGLRGGVGELVGFTVLLLLATVLAGLGAASAILRDADPEAAAAVARLEAVPESVRPADGSYWPVLGAFGATVSMVGLVVSPVLFVIGLFVVGFALLEWMIKAWSERATGDPEVNRQIRARLMSPVEIPVFAAVGVVVGVLAASRVFLALSKTSSSVAAIVVSSLILAIGFLIAYRPKLSGNVVAGVVVITALAVLGGGVAAAIAGEREFEHHGEEEGGHEEGEAEHGLAPLSGLAPVTVAKQGAA